LIEGDGVALQKISILKDLKSEHDINLSLLAILFCFRFLNVMRESEFKSKSEMANHILLFVSALVPKALSSLMTSFCIELAKPQNVSKSINQSINQSINKSISQSINQSINESIN